MVLRLTSKHLLQLKPLNSMCRFITFRTIFRTIHSKMRLAYIFSTYGTVKCISTMFVRLIIHTTVTSITSWRSCFHRFLLQIRTAVPLPEGLSATLVNNLLYFAFLSVHIDYSRKFVCLLQGVFLFPGQLSDNL